jgi:hypothetical protein
MTPEANDFEPTLKAVFGDDPNPSPLPLRNPPVYRSSECAALPDDPAWCEDAVRRAELDREMHGGEGDLVDPLTGKRLPGDMVAEVKRRSAFGF